MNPSPINYAYLETTTHCNLKCSFCNREEVVGNHPIHMPLEKWEFLLGQLSDQPIKEAKLMGLGEPFLHPQFDKICYRFKDFFPKAFVITATNGQYRITEHFKQALGAIDLLYLSIDGAHKNYERDRYPATWDRLIQFLDSLATVDRQNCKFVVNYVINKKNIDDIETIEKLCHTYQLEELRLNIAQNWSEQTLCQASEYQSSDIEKLQRWRKLIRGRAPWTYSDCFWPHRGLYVDVFGNVKICCMNTNTQSIGNLFSQSLIEVRNSSRLKQIQRSCLDNVATDHCRNCSYKELSPLLEKLLPKEKNNQYESRKPQYHA